MTARPVNGKHNNNVRFGVNQSLISFIKDNYLRINEPFPLLISLAS